MARGGLYGEGSPVAHYEHAETLLRGLLSFIGITDTQFIIAEGLNYSADTRKAAVDHAMVEVSQVQLPDCVA